MTPGTYSNLIKEIIHAAAPKPTQYTVTYRDKKTRRTVSTKMELYAANPGDRVYEAMDKLRGIGTRVRVQTEEYV